VSADHVIPSYALTFAFAAVAGGFAGSYMGSRQLPVLGAQRLLSVILVIAGYKVLFA